MAKEVTFKVKGEGMGVYSKASLYAAIADKCADCIHDPLEAGSSRQQRKGCSFPDCSLYPYRLGASSRKEFT